MTEDLFEKNMDKTLEITFQIVNGMTIIRLFSPFLKKEKKMQDIEQIICCKAINSEVPATCTRIYWSE